MFGARTKIKTIVDAFAPEPTHPPGTRRGAENGVDASGEGRNRTGDTTVFSRVLYQLSYLARAARSLARHDRRFGGSEPFHQDIDELRLHQDGVCTSLRHCLVERRMLVAGQCDHAHAWMVASEAGDRRDTVEPRHVQVDDHRVG